MLTQLAGLAGSSASNLSALLSPGDSVQLSPTSTASGSPDIPLTVSGDNFTSASSVQWNGEALPTTLLSSTQLQTTVPASLTTQPGTATVTAGSLAPLPRDLDELAATTGQDGRIYVLGGNASGQPSDRAYAYTPGTNTWEQLPDLPGPRMGLAATTGADGSIYAIGNGLTADSTPLSVYKPKVGGSATWQALAPLPQGRGGLAAATGLDGTIYALGGYDANGTFAATVYAYSPSTDTWTAKAPLPEARALEAATTGPDGRIYVLGGDDANNNTTATVWAYSPATDSWDTTLPSLPTPRQGLAALTGTDGRIYAVGGTNLGNSSVYAYTPGDSAWVNVGSLPDPRYNLAAGMGPDGQIYAFGGDGAGFYSGTNTTQAVTPADTPASASATFTVTPSPLAATGTSLTASTGVSFTTTVASFTDANANGAAGAYTARIDWGDDSPATTGTVIPNAAGGFDVTGTHTYAAGGEDWITVTVAEAGSGSVTTYSSATVATDGSDDGSTSQTPATVNVEDAGRSFNGSAFEATATVNGGSTLEGAGLTLDYQLLDADGNVVSDLGNVAPSAPGTYQVTASFAGSTDYGAASDSALFTITPASPTVSVVDAGGTYNGSAFGGTATVAGVVSGVDTRAADQLEGVGLTLDYQQLDAAGNVLADLGSTAPTQAGSYQVTASFAGSTDYVAATDSALFTIAQASPGVSVVDAGGTYNGTTFGATATVTGVNTTAADQLEGVGLTLDYQQLDADGNVLADLGSTAPSTPGSYQVTASFAGSTDYAATTQSALFTISQAAPVVRVADAGGTYNGAAFGGTATVAGVDTTAADQLEGVGLTLDYQQLDAAGNVLADLGSTAPTQAGSYQVTASFAGSTDYAAATDSALFTIAQATPTVTVTDAGGTYNGRAFKATARVNGGQSLEGVGLTLDYQQLDAAGNVLADLGSTAPTHAGIYEVTASFTGSTNYTAAASSTLFTISQAPATVSVVDAGGTYNGRAFKATARVNGGPSLEGVGLTLDYQQLDAAGNVVADLGSTAPINAGSYRVTASFAGSTDYAVASKSAPFTISQAPATVTVADAGGTYNGKPFAATARVNGGPSLEGVGLTLDYQQLDATGKVVADLGSTAPSSVGSYRVTASFAGSTDYAAASKSVLFAIARATPTVTVADAGGTYNGKPFAATARVNGGPSLEGVSLTLDYQQLDATGKVVTDLGSTAPSSAGSYRVTASFAGSTDYAAASKSVLFAITQATPTVTVADAGGTYNGKPFAATARVNGGSSLEGVGLTLDYQQLDATGKVVADLGSTAPISAGSYRVTASFAGSTDYAAASKSALFTIKAVPTLALTTSTSAGVVTLQVTVKGTTTLLPTPTGTVTITVDGGSPQTLSLDPSTGQVKVPLGQVTGARRKVLVVYSGDQNFSGTSGYLFA